MVDSKQQAKAEVSFHTVDDNHEGQRIDNFLLSRLKGVPKSRIYRLLRRGEVRVNRSRVKQDYKLCIGDLVRIPPVRVDKASPPPGASEGLADLLQSSVLYEDKGLLVVNKPSGLAVHGGSGVNIGLIEALRSMRPEAKFLELVHRLDRDTSGCVMIAKKRSMLRYLHEQLRTGGIDKNYLALVVGRWPQRKKMVNAPLLKNHLRSGERMVTVNPEGKQSLTEFSVLERFQQATLVEAKPITGRTHQIRVHAKHAGHALLGDEKYGSDEDNKRFRQWGLKRLFLHAVCLSLTLPDGHETLVINAPLDAELEHVLTAIRVDH